MEKRYNARTDPNIFIWSGSIESGPRSFQEKPRPRIYFPYSLVINSIYPILRKKFDETGELKAKAFSSYFRTIRKFHFLNLIGGKFDDLGGLEGPSNLRHEKSRKKISIDFYIPEKRWVEYNTKEFQLYYSEMVSEGLKMCLEKAQKTKGEVLDEKGFLERCESAPKEYIETKYKKVVW